MTLKVNGETIPESAVEYELTRLVKFYSQHMSPQQLREQMPLLREKARDQAIGAKLLLNEAEILDLEVSEEEVMEKLNELVASTGGEEKFARMIAQQNLPLESIKAGLLRSCRLDRHIAKITEQAPEPTEADIEQHFKLHADEYRKPDRAQARHILVKPERDDESGKAEARSKINDIRQRILEGADFADEAAAHSSCPSGRSHGGSLGWITQGSMVAAFDEAVFSMEVDDLSEIIETEFGYHIIEKKAHEEGGAAAFEDVRESIRAFLRHARRGEILAAHVEELTKKADIVKA